MNEPLDRAPVPLWVPKKNVVAAKSRLCAAAWAFPRTGRDRTGGSACSRMGVSPMRRAPTWRGWGMKWKQKVACREEIRVVVAAAMAWQSAAVGTYLLASLICFDVSKRTDEARNLALSICFDVSKRADEARSVSVSARQPTRRESPCLVDLFRCQQENRRETPCLVDLFRCQESRRDEKHGRKVATKQIDVPKRGCVQG